MDSVMRFLIASVPMEKVDTDRNYHSREEKSSVKVRLRLGSLMKHSRGKPIFDLSFHAQSLNKRSR